MKKLVSDYFSENHSLEELLDNANSLTAGIQEGLRYMMTRLASYHALLELELENNPAGNMYIKESDHSLAKALELLDAMSESSVLSRSIYDSINLKILISGVAKKLNKLDKFNISLDFTDLENKEAFIRGNTFLLQQLFFDLPSLISNQSATREALTVRGSFECFDNDFFGARKTSPKAGDFICITVSSTNEPVNSRDLISVFEKHINSKDCTFPKQFFLVQGVLRNHGGDLYLTKQPESSHSCMLLFPLQKNPISMYSEESPENKALKGSETLLLADDEDIIWDVVIDMLQNLGYTVILAANGKDCVEIYRDNPGEIDLVLLDMVMPEMDGHEAYFELRKIDPEVKVLLSSGYVEEKDAQDVLNAGAAGFLQKPYRMLELAKKIRKIIDG